MVASKCTPQPASCRIAARSFGCVISSTAIQSGFMPRSSISIPSAFLQPDSTSVHGPRSNALTPPAAPASSSRSSTTATRCPASDRTRMQLRSSVVLPLPGAPASRQELSRYGRSSCGGCRISRGMRMASDETSRIPATRPPCTTALPHTPQLLLHGVLRLPARRHQDPLQHLRRDRRCARLRGKRALPPVHHNRRNLSRPEPQFFDGRVAPRAQRLLVRLRQDLHHLLQQ